MKILTQPSEHMDMGTVRPVPASLKQFITPWLNASFREYDKGYILTQEHLCNDYGIYIVRISFQQAGNFYIHSPQGTIGFISVLEGTLRYPGRYRENELPEDMCAFMYVPEGISCICLEDRPCMAVYIRLPEKLTGNMLTLNDCVKELDKDRKTGQPHISHQACIWTNDRINQLVKTLINGTPADSLNVSITIFNIISEYLLMQPRASSYSTYFTGKRSVLKEIKEKIEQDPQRQLTVKELATEYGLRPGQLSSGFRDTYGVHLREFAEMCIMVKARLLLRTTNYTLKDISFDLGYANAPAFTRAYTKYYGYNPSLERSGKYPENKVSKW